MGQCTVQSSTLLNRATFTSSRSWVHVNNALTWDEANDCCLSVFHGYLATITSLEENTEILDVIDSSTWIGIIDPFESDYWQWVDGNTLTYARWSFDHMDGPDTYPCARLLVDSYWRDEPCSNPADFVCNVNQCM